MKILSLGSAILTPLAVVLISLGALARIDSHDDLVAMRVMDVILGLMLAASFVMARESKQRRRWITVVGALAIWLLVSGSLLRWHDWQVHVRTSAANHYITLGRIAECYGALAKYADDCGSFPSEAQGLSALRENPGRVEWKGPYISDERSIHDAWGHQLRYTLHDNKPVVWSCGKNGIVGSKEDITLDSKVRTQMLEI